MPGNIAVGPKSEDVASAVNMQPQLVNLKMRPGSTERFNVTIYVSKNYPVDLYYLVDNTVSMMDDFKNLAVLSDQLIAEMNSLTQNFHLGLGTFSDKPMRPWIFTDFYTQVNLIFYSIFTFSFGAAIAQIRHEVTIFLTSTL